MCGGSAPAAARACVDILRQTCGSNPGLCNGSQEHARRAGIGSIVGHRRLREAERFCANRPLSRLRAFACVHQKALGTGGFLRGKELVVPMLFDDEVSS
jgi:hypothetical protein